MRTRQRGSVRAGRRRIGAVSALFLTRRGSSEGGQGKQDKGSVSRPWLSICLHIVSSGDRPSGARDWLFNFFGFPGCCLSCDETLARVEAARG